MRGFALLKFLSVALLILANAFFVAAEFALVSIRQTRIEQLLASGVPGARAVLRLQRDLDDFLPAVQLGVTLCSLALGWIGEPLAASVLLGWFDALPFSFPSAQIYAHLIAVGLGLAIITYFHVLVGELVPKSLALARAEALAVAVAPPMLAFMALSRPAVRLLSSSASAILRGFDVSLTERAVVHSPDELRLIATAARRMGLLPRLQEGLIHRALELSEVPIREIMTPRQKIFSLASNMPVEEAIARVFDHKFSRVPVYDESRGPEQIIGVVYLRDLSRLLHVRSSAQRIPPQPGASAVHPFAELRLIQIKRQVLVVPETKSVLDLITEFQRRHRHLAIVVDEYGSTVGLVTAEDALEQLAGEFEDEFDDPVLPALAGTGGALVMDGSINLRDLETQMQWDLPRDGGVETLAGFLLTRLGHIPQPGESVVYEGRRFTVVAMDARRIAKIRVESVEPEIPSDHPVA